MKTRLLLIFLFISLSLSSIAQNTRGTLSIKGIIADSISKKPIDYVTLSLKNEAKQALKSTLTKDDGSFNFEKIQPGKYILTIVNIGYSIKNISVDVSTEKQPNDIGTILISAQSSQLKEVTITADKPMVKLESDRIAYDLQADPESKVNSVLDMMRKVPLLSLDGEDNILLRGEANYRILINGKPSSMVERSPKEILRSMPASTIERIEVITTPPAKYDAEGLAGIINIITTRKIDNGYNGTLNANGRFPVGGPGFGGNFTFKQGRIGMNVQAGASIYNSPMAYGSNNRIATETDGTILNQYSARRSDGRNGYSGIELSYEIDTLNLLSGQFNINGNTSKRKETQVSALNGQEGLLQGYNLLNNNNGNGSGMDAALNYQLGFKANKVQLLTFSYRYYSFRNEQFSGLNISDPVNYLMPDYHQNNIGSATEQTFQADYVQPVKKLTIEAGVKGIFRLNRSNFRYESLNANTGEFEEDPTRTNQFDNHQDVFSAYNSYQVALKSWSLKAGIRIEETRIDANFISGNSQLKRDFVNVVPSISLSKKFKNSTAINFGFTQRIQRPNVYQLNPFIDRSNPSFEKTGNPDLHPQISNMYTIGINFSKKVPLNIVFGFYDFQSVIMDSFFYDAETNITRIGIQNTGGARVWQLNLNMNHNLTKNWNLSINGNVAHGRVKGEINGVAIHNQGIMTQGSISTGYKFDKGWRINGNLFMNGPNLNLQNTSNWFFNSSFSVNKDLVKDKLAFSLSSNNPFAKYRTNRLESFGPGFTQTTLNQNFYRGYNMSLNYKFGKLKDAIKKNKRGINNDDVSNSQPQ